MTEVATFIGWSIFFGMAVFALIVEIAYRVMKAVAEREDERNS